MSKHFLQERILDSVVFNRDIEVGRQEGHQLQSELDLKRQTLKKSEFNVWIQFSLSLAVLSG